MFFDKLLDREAPGIRGLLLVLAAALLGAVLVVQGALQWRSTERAARAKAAQSVAATACTHTTK